MAVQTEQPSATTTSISVSLTTSSSLSTETTDLSEGEIFSGLHSDGQVVDRIPLAQIETMISTAAEHRRLKTGKKSADAGVDNKENNERMGVVGGATLPLPRQVLAAYFEKPPLVGQQKDMSQGELHASIVDEDREPGLIKIDSNYYQSPPQQQRQQQQQHRNNTFDGEQSSSFAHMLSDGELYSNDGGLEEAKTGEQQLNNNISIQLSSGAVGNNAHFAQDVSVRSATAATAATTGTTELSTVDWPETGAQQATAGTGDNGTINTTVKSAVPLPLPEQILSAGEVGPEPKLLHQRIASGDQSEVTGITSIPDVSSSSSSDIEYDF
jgi:hypothetical protein